MLGSVTLAAWGTRAGQSPPFRAEAPVGSGPPLRFRSLGAATPRVGLRQGRGLFSVARRPSEGSERVLGPAEAVGRSWGEGRPGMWDGPRFSFRGHIIGPGRTDVSKAQHRVGSFAHSRSLIKV